MPAKNKTGKGGKKVHTCPFCDEEIRQAAFPYCVACSIHFVACPSCGTDFSRDVDICPECGAERRKPMVGI